MAAPGRGLLCLVLGVAGWVHCHAAAPPGNDSRPSLAQHGAEDCWGPCGNRGGWCSWCGSGNACCKEGFLDDPAECREIFRGFSTSHHECVHLARPPAEDPVSKTRLSNGSAVCNASNSTTQDLVSKTRLSNGSEVCNASNSTTQETSSVQHAAEETSSLQHAAEETSSLQHAAEDCWGQCGKPGACAWCGAGSACCKRGFAGDPPECKRGKGFRTCHHECVALADEEPPQTPAPPNHAGLDCWRPCFAQGGYCDWCGAGNACCKRGDAGDPPECRGAVNNLTNHHECVAVSPRVDTQCGSPDCWRSCGGKGGHCDWCGAGLACCKKGSPDDPAECQQATGFLTKHHECVAIPETSDMIEPLKNAGADCWAECGLRGGACYWCGIGNACCKKGSEGDPPECRKAVNFSTTHHECVALDPDGSDVPATQAARTTASSPPVALILAFDDAPPTEGTKRRIREAGQADLRVRWSATVLEFELHGRLRYVVIARIKQDVRVGAAGAALPPAGRTPVPAAEPEH